MKKVLKICCALITMMYSFNLVKAERLTCEKLNSDERIQEALYAGGDGYDDSVVIEFNMCVGSSNSCTSTSNESKHYNTPIYMFRDPKGLAYSAFCRNPGVTGGWKEGYNDKFICSETLFDSDSDTKNIYNAGVIGILKKGYNFIKTDDEDRKKIDIQDIEDSIDSYISYASTLTALRVYEVMWGPAGIDTNNYDALDTSDQNKIQLHRYLANLFLDDAEIKKIVAEIEGTNDWIGKYSNVDVKLYSVYSSNHKFNVTGNKYNTLIEMAGASYDDEGVIGRAKQLIKEGLIAARDYKNNGAAKISGYDKPLEQPVYEKNDANGNKVYKKEITYTFKAENFKSSDAYIKLNFVCTNCNKYAADYTIYINGTSAGKNMPSNLVSYLNADGDGEIKVKIVFETSSTSYNCGNIKYTMNLAYYDETINTEAFTMSSPSCPADAECQGFYVLYDYGTDVFEEKTIEGSFRLCELDCKELERQCNLKNADACEEFQKKFNSTCIECGASIKNAVCTDKDSDINITEGTEYDEKTCTNKQETNVLQCIINNEDEAGNSYQATEIVSNSYCTVWCKEDFHLKMPGNQYTNSGRYFTLNASITGTKTCYTSAINKDQFKSDYAIANTEVRNAYTKYQNGTGTESQLNKEINDLETIISDYNSCSNWSMDYQFEPEVEFWVEESYMNDKTINKVMDATGSVTKSSSETLRCSSDTNDTYESCDTNWTKDNKTENLSLYTCYKENGTYKCGYKNFEISNTMRMKSSITATGKYITPTQFYNIYPNVGVVQSQTKLDIKNSSPLINALPVDLNTKKGVYNYTLKVNKLGEYYDSDDLGRVWGNEDSVISVTLEEQGKNSQCSTGALVDKIQINDKTFTNGVYSCGYVVNCPDCPVVCEPSCSLNCPTGGCPVVCEPSCIFNNENINISYRPITPDSLNPSDRELGTNWNPGDVSTEVEIKAYVTTEEIEQNSESIYDISFESNDSDEDFAMQVTLNGKMISKIREYNDRYEDTTGYLNNSLECYNHENNNDGKTYENIYCYSTFLDELLKDNDTKNNIKITGGERLLDKEDREAKTQWSGYWTTWSEVNRTEWTVVTEKELAWYGTGINIGPAWK